MKTITKKDLQAMMKEFKDDSDVIKVAPAISMIFYYNGTGIFRGRGYSTPLDVINDFKQKTSSLSELRSEEDYINEVIDELENMEVNKIHKLSFIVDPRKDYIDGYYYSSLNNLPDRVNRFKNYTFKMKKSMAILVSKYSKEYFEKNYQKEYKLPVYFV